MKFEDKKFCKISTLAERWDCSPRTIYRLLEKEVLTAFHPESSVGTKGIRVDVGSILAAEQNGVLNWQDRDK